MALDSGQLCAECGGQRPGQDGLAYAGDVLDEQVGARKGGDHRRGDGDRSAEQDAGEGGVQLGRQGHGIVNRVWGGRRRADCGASFRDKTRDKAWHRTAGDRTARHRDRLLCPAQCLDAGGHGSPGSPASVGGNNGYLERPRRALVRPIVGGPPVTSQRARDLRLRASERVRICAR